MIAPTNPRRYRVRCASGLMGWRVRLRSNYVNFEEFDHYSRTYGLSRRLRFRSASAAWRANPVIEGSIWPSDFRRV
jgi:hypothetical protein